MNLNTIKNLAEDSRDAELFDTLITLLESKNAPVSRLRRKDVAKKMGWSLSQLREKRAADEFIPPKYEGKTPYWLSTDVDNYIMSFFDKTQNNGETNPF